MDSLLFQTLLVCISQFVALRLAKSILVQVLYFIKNSNGSDLHGTTPNPRRKHETHTVSRIALH